jgi:hypothetical protein
MIEVNISTPCDAADRQREGAGAKVGYRPEGPVSRPDAPRCPPGSGDAQSACLRRKAGISVVSNAVGAGTPRSRFLITAGASKFS